MRASIRLSGLLAFSLFLASSIFAQTNPPPSDPHELVIHQPRILSRPAERSAAIDLLENARQDLNMHIFGAYELKASFQTSGGTQNEGNGTMEELSNGPEWRWTAQISGTSVIRVGGNGHAYGANPNEPIPMRIQEIRAALHWPIFRNAGAQSVIRSANEQLNSKPVTCLLLSSAVPENPAPRAWVEEEYCIDPTTGLLQMWSAAPGIYTEYDYEGAAEFNKHILPRQISIFEGGALVVQARVESFGAPGEIDPNAFKPGPEMTDAGESFILSGPRRFPMRVDPSNGPTSTYFQPVIIHATLDAQEGRVMDAEALQNSNQDLGRAALELVKSTSFNATGFQQEVFISVQFHLPAQQMGGVPVLHSSVHWVIWEHSGKSLPRKPVRDAA
jgi:hypothetical protein